MIIKKVSQLMESRNHLPIIHSLKKYNIDSWICFGCLTHRFPTTVKTQVDHFKTLMDTLGGPNHCYGKRLHWFLRVEGGDGIKDRHLHFLLGGHKVTNGHYYPYNISEVSQFLTVNWSHGIAHIQPYESARDGVGYVTKIKKTEEREDYFELSDSLRKHFLREVAA